MGILVWLDEFMRSVPLWEIALLVVVVSPIATVLHGLGHGLVAAYLSEDEVGIEVGDPKLTRLGPRLGRLTFAIRPFRALIGGGSAHFNPERCSTVSLLLISLAGPAVTVGCAIAAFALAQAEDPGTFLFALFSSAALLNGLGAILCLVPMTLDGEGPNDGRQLLEIIKLLRRGRLTPEELSQAEPEVEEVFEAAHDAGLHLGHTELSTAHQLLGLIHTVPHVVEEALGAPCPSLETGFSATARLLGTGTAKVGDRWTPTPAGQRALVEARAEQLRRGHALMQAGDLFRGGLRQGGDALGVLLLAGVEEEAIVRAANRHELDSSFSVAAARGPEPV